jgi:hypothetical protein
MDEPGPVISFFLLLSKDSSSVSKKVLSKLNIKILSSFPLLQAVIRQTMPIPPPSALRVRPLRQAAKIRRTTARKRPSPTPSARWRSRNASRGESIFSRVHDRARQPDDGCRADLWRADVFYFWTSEQAFFLKCICCGFAGLAAA